MQIELERKAYSKLLAWKNEPNHSTLEVSGARQVGKTYLVNKFADREYKRKIYVNLLELSGELLVSHYRDLIQDMKQGEWYENPVYELIKRYDPTFVDDSDTVVIIDEIQESADIYNRIREFTRNLACDFIITGSYLGRIYDPEFRYSSGDVTKLTIYTLSFEEFLMAYDQNLYGDYKKISLVSSEAEVYNRLKETYELYCQIGGYPKVVENYLENRNIVKAQGELVKIIDTFTNESIRYFTDILYTKVFTHIFFSICRILNREKKGFSEDSISEELQKLVTKDYSSNISKATCNRAISWLYFSGIIGFCAKITEMDILDFKSASRCYFMDMGLANYYLTRTGTDSRVLAGTLNENYVYINLKKRQDFPPEISFETPAFATYRGGEIDFLAQSLSSSTRYLIEVKAGKGTASTAQKALAQGKADKLLYLKGATKGGIDGKTETLPIYLLEQYKFN